MMNTAVATPQSVGTAARRRRPTYVSTPGARPSLPSSRRLGVHRVERLVRHRGDPGHLRRVHDRELLGPQEDPRRVVPDLLLGVAVLLRAGIAVRLDHCPLDEAA